MVLCVTHSVFTPQSIVSLDTIVILLIVNCIAPLHSRCFSLKSFSLNCFEKRSPKLYYRQDLPTWIIQWLVTWTKRGLQKGADVHSKGRSLLLLNSIQRQEIYSFNYYIYFIRFCSDFHHFHIWEYHIYKPFNCSIYPNSIKRTKID